MTILSNQIFPKKEMDQLFKIGQKFLSIFEKSSGEF
jgi:hypothetical protein